MKGQPKFKLGDNVQFFLEGEGLFHGYVYIVDAYGTWDDPSDVSYDIMVQDWGEKKEECLFKHISEKLLTSYTEIKNE